MGQKVNPHGARVGVIKDWSARWYANKKDFSNYLVEDHALRTMLKEKLFGAGISHIDIERASNKVTVNIFTAKPGMIIGRGGAGIEALKKDIEAFLGRPANINIMNPVPNKDAKSITGLVRKNGKVSGYELSDGRVLSKREGVALAKQGGIRGVAIASRNGSEYLRSLPDGTASNNLGDLPSSSQE